MTKIQVRERATARRVLTLESLVEYTIDRADRLRSPIQYLGEHPLMGEIRVYRGVGREWVLAPLVLDPIFLETGGHYPIPRANLRHLKRLVNGGLNFRAVAIAHDIPRGMIQVDEPDDQVTGQALAIRENAPGTITRSSRATVISPEIARQLVTPVPVPRKTVELSRRYGRVCELMLKAIAIGATSAVGIAMAPMFVIPATFSGLSDPVVLGAIPLNGVAEPGSPAAWFVLTSWSY